MALRRIWQQWLATLDEYAWEAAEAAREAAHVAAVEAALACTPPESLRSSSEDGSDVTGSASEEDDINRGSEASSGSGASERRKERKKERRNERKQDGESVPTVSDADSAPVEPKPF